MPRLIKVKQIEGLGTPIETAYMLPDPYLVTTQGTQAAATTYVGARFLLSRAASMGKLIYRLTALTAGGTQRFLIYQTANGGGGTASKVASVTGAPAGAGATNVNVAFEQGTVAFKPGYIWVLWGKPIATNSTMRVYTNNAFDLLNQNMDATTPPITFTTAINAAAADPATFDPLVAAVATTTDVAPVIRFAA